MRRPEKASHRCLPQPLLGFFLLSGALLGLGAQGCVGPEPSKGGDREDFSNLTVLDFDPDRAREGISASSTGGVVTTDELPEDLRAILDAWRQGGFVWEVKRGEVLSSERETNFLVDNLVLLLFDEARAMRTAVGAVDIDPSQRPLLLRVRSELRLCGEPGALALAETLGLGDDMLARMAIEVLGGLGPYAAPAVAGLLGRDAAVVRYRALGCLARLPSAGGREGEVIAALSRVVASDSSGIIRAAALRALGERGLFSQAGRRTEDVDFVPWARAVKAGLKDPEKTVRLEALGALGMLGEISVVPAVIDFGAGARGAERTAARRILEGLTKQQLGTDFDAWNTWWVARATQDEN